MRNKVNEVTEFSEIEEIDDKQIVFYIHTGMRARKTNCRKKIRRIIKSCSFKVS